MKNFVSGTKMGLTKTNQIIRIFTTPAGTCKGHGKK